MQLELLNDQGQAASKFEAPETVFGREYNEDLVHQIVVAFQANARQGTQRGVRAIRADHQARPQAARIGDPTVHGGRIAQGCPTVLIGSDSYCMKAAASGGAGFIRHPD